MGLFFVCLGFLRAQVSITTYSGYVQSFDGLSGTGSAGTLVPWSDNAVIQGWYAYHGRQSASYTPGPPIKYFVDDGSSSAGGEGLRSYGSLTANQTNPVSDRAIGECSSTADSIPYAFAVRMVNNTGYSINSFSVSYFGEQWRQNSGTAGLVFEYQVNAPSIMGGTWTSVPSLDFLPLKNGIAGALDGNAPDNRIFKSNAINVTVQNGLEIWLRWTKKGTQSCGLAIDDFSVRYEPAAQPTNLFFTNVSATSMGIAFAPSVPNVAGYLVLQKEGSVPTGFPMDDSHYAVGDSIGDARVDYFGAGTAFIRTNLNPNTLYNFAVFAFNGSGSGINYLTANPLIGGTSTLVARASLKSDVVAVNGSESPLISSMINDASPLTIGQGIQVWQMMIRDGGNSGDSDVKPTIINELLLTQGGTNTISNWSSSILAADLFEGPSWVASGAVSEHSMSFTGLNDTVPDNGSKTFSLRLSLKKNGITDHQVFQCSLSPQNILTESDSTSSQMASFTPILSDGTKNIVHVAAAKLNILQQPSSTILGNPIVPPVTVAATDSNANIDIDFSAAIRITADGAVLSGDPVNIIPSSGMATFGALVFTSVGSAVTLTASTGSWSVTSLSFQVAIHRTFYVDSIAGNDAHDGLAAATAWKTLSKVNTTTFQPGDSILFRSGCTWSGMLNPKGSGDSIASIVIDKYGGTVKPVINGNGITGYGTLYFYNQQYWEVNNLEITNDAATGGDRRGVYILFYNVGVARHMYLKNLYIHNVKGLIGDDLIHKKTAGIGIETNDNGTVPTRCDDLLIEGCTIAYIENQGLYTANLASNDYPTTPGWMSRRFTNVRIRNNIIHHISKNAMIIRFFDGGLIENNVCYETATGTTGNTMFTTYCNGTVFQYNEGYFNRASLQGGDFGDGSMYDADLKSINITFQYSYSHDNSHGLLWTATNQSDSNIVCRYNVSRNDQGIIFCIDYPNTSVYIYNNTVYCETGSPQIISERNINGPNAPGPRTYHFYNNIIYSLSPNTQPYEFRTSNYIRYIDYNLYYGYSLNEPADAHKLKADPQFSNVPSGSPIGLNSAAGFALKPTSPAINYGKAVYGRPDKDFLGNPVPSDGAVDLGAFEYQKSSGTAERGEHIPYSTSLEQNYPNPFNPSTQITYSVPHKQKILIEVFTILGTKVCTLVDDVVSAGSHTISFQAANVSTGIYLYRMQTPEFISVKKMAFVK